MALGTIAGKAAKTGELLFHAAGVKEIIDFIKNLAKNKEVQGKAVEVVKQTLDGKGLDDENLFESALVDAEEREPSLASKFTLIRKVMGELQLEDEKNGTKYARNARLIVLLGDLKTGNKKTIPTFNKKGQVSGSVTIDTESKDRPSVKILRRLAKTTATKNNIRQYFFNIGAFQNAPMGTLDDFQWWLRHDFLKKISGSAETMAFYAELFAEEIGGKIARHTDELQFKKWYAHNLPWFAPKNATIRQKIIAPLEKMANLAFHG